MLLCIDVFTPGTTYYTTSLGILLIDDTVTKLLKKIHSLNSMWTFKRHKNIKKTYGKCEEMSLFACSRCYTRTCTVFPCKANCDYPQPLKSFLIPSMSGCCVTEYGLLGGTWDANSTPIIVSSTTQLASCNKQISPGKCRATRIVKRSCAPNAQGSHTRSDRANDRD